VWLAGIPGARETRLTPSKKTCRLRKQENLPTEGQENLPTEEQENLPTEEQENLPTAENLVYFKECSLCPRSERAFLLLNEF
jgi:hypothetical protein